MLVHRQYNYHSKSDCVSNTGRAGEAEHDLNSFFRPPAAALSFQTTKDIYLAAGDGEEEMFLLPDLFPTSVKSQG